MSARKKPPIVLAAGGTGGHMFPAQALARALLGRGAEVALITDRRGAGFGPELPQAATYRVSAGGIAGRGLLKRVHSGISLAVGYFQARQLLKTLAPETVVGFGGYASVPTAAAATRLGLRVVLHEQNAVLGRANRLLAGRARAIATCFAEVEGLSPEDQHKVTLTGNPVRPAIAALSRRPFAVPTDKDRVRLLVTGGSQGARVFNQVVPAALCLLPERLRARIELSQQVPGDEQASIAAEYRSCGVDATISPFFEDLPERLATAQLVICRAGASTMAELTTAGRPAIMVPFPFATDDHQSANARSLVEAGGGWLIPQSALTPEYLAERLVSLFSAPAMLARAGSCAKAAAHLDADQHLADLVLGVALDNGGEDHDESGNEEAAA